MSCIRDSLRWSPMYSTNQGQERPIIVSVSCDSSLHRMFCKTLMSVQVKLRIKNKEKIIVEIINKRKKLGN